MNQAATPLFAPDDKLSFLSEHFEKRRFLHAKQYAQQLLEEFPQDFRLHNFMGETLSEMGRYQEAMQSYQQARKLNEKQPQIYLSIGNLFLRNAQYKEAIEYYEAALHLDPEFVDAMCNRATTFAKMDKVDDAIAAYEEVIEKYPGRPLIHYNLMEILEKTNRKQHLKRAVKQALDAGMEDASIKLFEGLIAWKEGEPEKAIEILTPLNFSFGTHQQKILQTSTLMRAHDKLNDVDKAMEYCEELNDLCVKADHAPPDLAQQYRNQLAQTQKVIHSLDPKQWHRHTLENPRDDLAFLIGWPRSGTTLLDTSLRGHPEIQGIEEKPMVTRMLNQTGLLSDRGVSMVHDFTPELQHQAIAAYDEEFNKHLSGGINQFYIDKLPLNISQAVYIERVFPGAKFILALRHPCDCILSCYMNRFTLNAAMANFLMLEWTVSLYDQVMSMWVQLNEKLDLNVYTLKYEDMVEDREPVLRGLVDFLELEWHADVLEHQKTAATRDKINTPSYNQVIQPIYDNARYRWQRYEKYFEPHMDVLNKWITHWGYDQ
ncbi:MAG: sulfotransferase [Rickettsiales bacterium]|nr:sulfotransferase [Rickettsiales bacterium]